MREAAAPGLPCPLPWEEAPAGPGAVCAMPTSFTVVPVEAQGEERDGQRQEEEEEEDEERDRGSGEREGSGEVPGTHTHTHTQCLRTAPAGWVCERAGFPRGAGGLAAGGLLQPVEGPHRLSAAGAIPGLPVQVEKSASGEGESPPPGVAETLFLFVSASYRRCPKRGSAPGRLQPGERSSLGAGAAPARGDVGRSVCRPLSRGSGSNQCRW